MVAPKLEAGTGLWYLAPRVVHPLVQRIQEVESPRSFHVQDRIDQQDRQQLLDGLGIPQEEKLKEPLKDFEMTIE